jgi:hypothetical protein
MLLILYPCQVMVFGRKANGQTGFRTSAYEPSRSKLTCYSPERPLVTDYHSIDDPSIRIRVPSELIT